MTSSIAANVVYNDRLAANNNAYNLNLDLNYCRSNNVELDLGVGTIFFCGMLDVSGVTIKGHGVGLWMMQPIDSNGYKDAATTQLVATDFANWPTSDLIKIHGISSCEKVGAGRKLKKQRNGADWPTDNSVPSNGYYEQYWKLTSCQETLASNANSPVGVAKNLRVALLSEKPNTVIENVRIMQDGGGADGMGAYLDPTHGSLIGDLDIGILQLGGWGCRYRNIQIVGHWRIAGYANYATSRAQTYDYPTQYTPPYETFHEDSVYEGMRAISVRGPDKWAILAATTSTVDLPWADDHPFTLDIGFTKISTTEKGVGTSRLAVYSYTGVAKVNVEHAPGKFEDRIRLSGLTKFPNGEIDFPGGGDIKTLAVLNDTGGGANSHIIVRNCQIAGLTLPNSAPANHVKNPAGVQITDNGAIGGIEVSGWRCAEEEFHHCRIQHNGSVGLFKHDGRDGIYDVLLEFNPDAKLRTPVAGNPGQYTVTTSPTYGRIITSPSASINNHAGVTGTGENAIGHAAGSSRRLEWRSLLQTMYTSNDVDFAPAYPKIPRPDAFVDAGDDGWFQTQELVRPAPIRRADLASEAQYYNLAVPAIAVGPDAEGSGGFVPQGIIHAKHAGANADIVIETSNSSYRPSFSMLNKYYDFSMYFENGSSSDFSISVTNKNASSSTVVQSYLGTTTKPGMHFPVDVYCESNVHVESDMYTQSNLHCEGNVYCQTSLSLTRDNFSRFDVVSYRNSNGTHCSLAGYSAYGTQSVPLGIGVADTPLFEMNCLPYDGTNFVSRGTMAFYSTNPHSATNGGVYAGLDLTASGSTTKTRVATFKAGGVGLAIAGSIEPTTTNSYALGSSSKTWSAVYVASGTVTASDERLKGERGAINNVLLDAWSDVQWSQYRFVDAMSAKGERARWHLGLIAQQVRDAIDARLGDGAAERYGLLCHDSWDEQVEVTQPVMETRKVSKTRTVRRDIAETEIIGEDEQGQPITVEKLMPREFVEEYEEEEEFDTGKVIIVRPYQAAGEQWGLRYEECFAVESAWQRREIDRLKALLRDR